MPSKQDRGQGGATFLNFCRGDWPLVYLALLSQRKPTVGTISARKTLMSMKAFAICISFQVESFLRAGSHKHLNSFFKLYHSIACTGYVNGVMVCLIAST